MIKRFIALAALSLALPVSAQVVEVENNGSVPNAQALGLTRAELKRVARNSLEASFVPESLRAPWLMRLDAMPD